MHRSTGQRLPVLSYGVQPHAESGRLRQRSEELLMSSAPYTLSVKLSDFTVWRHTWRINWVNCAVWIGYSAGLRNALSSRLSHRTAQFTQGIPQFPQFTCRHHDGIISFLAIHSADEHRMIYLFSNTTSYRTFYAFFPSFRITLWPMWLANSKRQPCFYPPQSHAQEDTHNWQKNPIHLMGNLCCANEHSVQFFVQSFYAVKLRVLT